jgi:Uma2 family endonuclease
MATKLTEPQTRRWTREEYDRLADEGWFEGQRVMLLKGEIVQMPPQGPTHTKSILLTQHILQTIFEPKDVVRVQMPMNFVDQSDPEPDLAVVAGTARDYKVHPTTALLIVEVADTSLRIDRRKASLYAAAGVSEYWIINLGDMRLEVHRDPAPDATAEWGAAYREVKPLSLADSVSPITASQIRVTDLFE